MQGHDKEVGHYKENSDEDNKIMVVREENIIDLTEGATSESESEVMSRVMEVDDLESEPDQCQLPWATKSNEEGGKREWEQCRGLGRWEKGVKS